MSLEAKNLSFRYRRGQPPVLQAVNLTVHPGERVGLRGPSGRGKTTLCKLLAGYERPCGGQVLLDGRPLSGFRGCCPVQLIWQHPETAVDPLLRLGDTLYEAGPVEEEVLEALHIAPAWLDRYPTELSGGELQRFCIARALRPETRFLLCDEITAMLGHAGADLGIPVGCSQPPGPGPVDREPPIPAVGKAVYPHRTVGRLTSACTG